MISVVLKIGVKYFSNFFKIDRLICLHERGYNRSLFMSCTFSTQSKKVHITIIIYKNTISWCIES